MNNTQSGHNNAAIDLVERIFLESLPHNTLDNHLEDFDTWPCEQQLNYWVDRQINAEIRDLYARLFNLMRRAQRLNNHAGNEGTLIPESALRELDVLKGSGSSAQHLEHSLANHIDRTLLYSGKGMLLTQLVQTKKAEYLINRQLAIQNMLEEVPTHESLRNTLGETTTLYKHVQHLIKKIVDDEKTFLSLWINEQEYEPLEQYTKQHAYKNLYGYEDTLNYSLWFVYINQLKDFILPLAYPFFAASLLPYICLSGNWLYIALGLIGVAQQLYGITSTIEHLKYSAMAVHLMHKKLISIARFLNNLKKIDDHIRAASKNLPKIMNHINDHHEIKQLLTILNSKTFKNPSFFSHWGKIIVAYRLMLKHRDAFIDAYITLGDIDYLASIASLIASTTDKAHFCFTEYHHADTYSIQGVHFWSVLLDPQTVTTNSVQMGGELARTILITGPNARGKTTAMRSLACAALLGSTVGISSAQKLCIPRNLNFLTAINLGDDPAQKLSLFKASVRRMAHIIETVNQDRSQPYLILIDEPFIGTDSKIAKISATTFITTLSQSANSCSLFSTHLPIKDLAEKHPETIANYHLGKNYIFQKGIDPDAQHYNQVALSIIEDEFREYPALIKTIATHIL